MLRSYEELGLVRWQGQGDIRLCVGITVWLLLGLLGEGRGRGGSERARERVTGEGGNPSEAG